MALPTERRQDQQRSSPRKAQVRLACNGKPDTVGQLVDLSEWGLGVETSRPLEVGIFVTVSGQFFSANSELGASRSARVVHCRSAEEGYRSGLAFEEPKDQNHDSGQATQVSESFVDLYEVLQVSPNADEETIHRVYRMLAQRYHPDNNETGDEEVFRRVLHAFHVLSDPEKRAAHDVQHRASRTVRWKVFDQPSAAQGAQAERKTRLGILSLLQTQRLEQPNRPGVNVRDLESLLGCPREHLEFSLWYLQAKSLISASDQGRYIITAEGVDFLESQGAPLWGPPRQLLPGSDAAL